MDIDQLQGNIHGFSFQAGPLGSQGYERVILQLFGYLGHGKSSFINSCIFSLSDGGEFKEAAEARETDHGLTMNRHAYPLTPNITLVDNRGCSTFHDFQKAEVYAQLGNFIRIGRVVNWRNDFRAMMEEITESDGEPNITDFIVPLFVYSAKTKLQEQERNDVKTFFNNCVKMTGVFPIIIITNKTSGDYADAERKFRGMGAKQVFAIENYTEESHIKTLDKTTDILMIIDWALKNVTYRLKEPRNPTKERIERKKFLLNYIHEATVEYEKQKKEKEESRRREEERRNRSWFLRLLGI